jgi:hypothetical protein
MKKLSLTLILIITSMLFSCSNNNLEIEQVKGPINDEPNKKEQKTSYYKENSYMNLPQNNEKSSDYIIPNSDKKKITAEILDKLTKSDIVLARNEIYARHGYIFKSKKYKEYFNKQSWYKANPNFLETDFTSIEDDNLKIIDNYMVSIKNFTTLITNNYGKFDLNLDGKIDEISVKFIENGTEYELSINNTKLFQKNGSNFKTVILYDINSNDEFKEIAIVDEEANKTHFHYYDGKNIIHMGIIPGNYDFIKVNGNGQILTEKQGSILGLNDWTYQLQCILTDKRALIKNPKLKYYDMNYEVVVKEDIKLFTHPNDTSKLITLKKDEVVKLTKSDDNQWCEIENSKGEYGWLKVENNIKIDEKYVSDYFDGITIN